MFGCSSKRTARIICHQHDNVKSRQRAVNKQRERDDDDDIAVCGQHNTRPGIKSPPPPPPLNTNTLWNYERDKTKKKKKSVILVCCVLRTDTHTRVAFAPPLHGRTGACEKNWRILCTARGHHALMALCWFSVEYILPDIVYSRIYVCNTSSAQTPRRNSCAPRFCA